MNDEFLKALRRDPPPSFARRLKQQLQAQEAQTKRRLWSRRIRMMLLLTAGPALAAGIYVLERHSSEPTPHSPPAHSAAETPRESSRTLPMPASNPSIPPMSQTVSERSTVLAPSGPEPPAVSGGPTRSRPSAKVATSPLADALMRDVLGGLPSESMQAGVAIGLLCTQDRDSRVDIAVTSRRITHGEFSRCRRDGLRIEELKIGYQVLVLTSARDSAPMKLSPSDVYLAVAKQVPDPLEPTRFVSNTNFTWDQVNASLAYRPIALFGPQRATPLHLLFESLLLEPGCNAQRSIEALRSSDPERHAELCHSVRGDRLYSEVEQTSSLIPQQLWADPSALLLVDYSFYRDNRSQLAGSALEGPEPSSETFADGTYPLARPIYVYTDAGILGRTEQGRRLLQNLHSLRLPGPNRSGFVAIDERDAREQRSRRFSALSESDFIPERSSPR